MSRTAARDPLFYLALAAALPVWAALWWLGQASGMHWDDSKLWPFLSLVLVKPLAEEIVFRGLIQTSLLQFDCGTKSWKGLTVANLITSVAFVALHFINHPALPAASVIAPSLIFGFFRDRHGHLGSCIGLHVFYNLGYFLLP